MEYAGSGVVGFTCFQCRISKVKCDRQSPCGRCVRLGVECVSQGRGPGRPPTKGKDAPVLVHSRGAAPTPPSSLQHSPASHPHKQSDEAHMTVVQGPHGHMAFGGYMPVGMGWIPPQAAFSYPAENVAHFQPQMPPMYLQGGVYGFPQAAFQQTMAQAYYTYAATQVVQGPPLAPLASHALPLVPPQHAVAVYQSPLDGSGSSCHSGVEAGWRSPADGVGGHKRRGDGDGEALVVSKEEEQQLHQNKRHKPMIQRVIVTFAMPQKLAEVMTGCLSRALDSNRVDHSKALAVLRIWSLSAFQSGADFTWGVLSNASKLLTRAGHQLRTTSGWVFLGPSRDEVNAEFGLEIENPTFSWDHVPEPLKRLDDGGSSALSSYIYINGVFRIFANQRFSDLFMTPQECNARMVEEQIMPVFVWARCFNDEGQQAFMETMITVAYTRHSNGGEASQVIVAVDRSGRELHSLVRVRYVFLNAGNYAAVVLSILPLPGGCLGDEDEIATPMQLRAGPSLFSAQGAEPLPQREAEVPQEAASSNQQIADQPRQAVVVLPSASAGDGSTNDLHEAFIQPDSCGGRQSAQQHGWQQSQFQPQLVVPLPPQADTPPTHLPPEPQQSAISPPTQPSQHSRVPLQQHQQQPHLPVQPSSRPLLAKRLDPDQYHEQLLRQQHPSPPHQRRQHQQTTGMESPQRFKPPHLRSPLPPSVPAYETRTSSGCPNAPTRHQEPHPTFDVQPPSIVSSPPVPPPPPPATHPLKPLTWPQGTPQPTSFSAGASSQLSSAHSSPRLASLQPLDPPPPHDNFDSWSSDPPPLPVQIRSRLGVQAYDSTPSSESPRGCGRHTETPTWSSSPARPWSVTTAGPSLERQSQTQWSNVPPPLLAKQESSASECSSTTESLSSLPQFTQSAVFGTMKPVCVADAIMFKSWSTCPASPLPAQQPQPHHCQPQLSRYSPPAPPLCEGQSTQVSSPCIGPTRLRTERPEDQPQTLIDPNAYQKENSIRHTHAIQASEQHMEVIINLPSGRRGDAVGFLADGGLTIEEQDPQGMTLQETSGRETVDGQTPRLGGEDGQGMTEGGVGPQGETMIMPPSVPRQAIEQPLELDEYLFGDGIEGDLLEQLESQALFEGFVWDDCGAQRQSGQGVS